MRPKGDENGVVSIPRAEWEALHARLAEMEAAQAEQQRLAEAIRESEAKYRTLFEAATDAVFLEALDGRVLDCNAAACQMFGYTREEFRGLTVADLVPEQVAATLSDVTSAIAATGGLFIEAVNKRKNGEIFPVQVNIRLVTLAGEPQAVVYVRDITEQKRAEQQTEERRVYLESVLACAPDAIVTTDAHHRVREWNAGAERLFGYTRQEATGRDLDELIATPDAAVFEQAHRFTRQVLSGQPVPPTETVRYHKDGTPRDVVVAGAPILSGGDLIGVVAVYTDIAGRKRAEAALHRRDAVLEAVTSAAERFLRAASWKEEIAEVLAQLGWAAEASRAYIFENHTAADGTLLASQRYEWAAPGIQPQIDNPELQNFPYLAGGFERWLVMLGRGQPICGHVRDFPPGEQEVLAAQEIRSIAIMPIFVGREWWGFIGFDECRAEREWSVAELDALRAAANTLGAAIQRQRAEEKLHQLQTFHESIVQNVSEGIAVQDTDLNFTFVNRAAATLLGYAPEELIGRHWTMVVPPDQQPIIQAADRRRMQGEADRYQVELLSRDGVRIPVLISGSPRFDPETGDFAGTLAVFTDIRERVQAEERLARHAREMAALYETSLEINSQPDLPTLLQAIVRRAARLVGVQMGGLYLVRPDGQELELLVSYNLPRDYTGTRLRPGEGLSGRILQTGEAIMVPDYRAWEGKAAVYADCPFRRTLGVPLRVKGRVIGVINVTDSEKTGEFSPDEVRLVRLFADQAAVAIENARLLEETSRRAVQMAILHRIGLAITSGLDLKEVLHALYEQLSRIMDTDAFYVALYDEKTGLIDFPLLTGLDGPMQIAPQHIDSRPGLTGYVIRSRQPLHLPDTWAVPPQAPYSIIRLVEPSTRSYLGVPLIVRERVIGVLSVQSYKPNAYTEADVQLLTTIASQAAVAIENARLFQETQRQAGELALLHETAVALSSSLEPDQVLSTLAGRMGQAVGVTSAYICDWDEETATSRVLAEWYAPEATERERQSDLGMVYDLRRFPTTLQALREKRPLTILASSPDLDEGDREEAGQYGWQAYLLVPMVTRDRVIGYAELWETRSERVFTPAEVRLCCTLAADAATAVERARLFQAERQQREQAEALREAAQVMGASLELNQTLRLILEQLKRVLVYDTASVFILRDGDVPDLIVGLGYADEEMTSQEAGRLLQNSPVLQQMARDLQPVVSADVRQLEGWIWVPGAEHVRSWLGIPLVSHGRMIGVLMADHSQPGFYGAAEMQIAQAIAQHAAQAIENARLFQAEREQRELAEALRQAAAAVSSTLDPDQILDQILEQVSRVVPNDAANVALIEGDRSCIVRCRGYERFGQEVAGLSLPLADTPSLRQMLHTGAPLIVPDTEAYSDWVRVPQVAWVRSYAAAPIRVQDRVIGFLSVDSATPNFFNQTHAERLRAFADQVSLALANAELFRTVAQSQRDWEVTFDAMQDGVAVMDRKRRIVRANRAFARIVGQPVSRLVGQSYRTVLEGIICLKSPCPFEQAMASGQPAVCACEYRGRTFEIQITPITGEGSGQPEHDGRAVYVMRDITDRIHAEETQRRLIAAVEQAAEAIAITDTGGALLYVNPAFERNTGYTQAEVLGRTLRILHSGRPGDTFYDQFFQALRSGQVWQGRHLSRRKDGSLYTEEATIAPVRNQAGEIVNYVATMRDVSREVQLEEQFRQAQKMEALGQLAGGIAHDFNNLLTIIHLSTRLLRRQLRPEDPLWEHVLRIEETGERASKLTRQLLSFSRREVVEPRVVNLNQIVADLSRMLQRVLGEEIELKTILAETLRPVRVDPSQIDQVILNLAVNARDAMPGGGTLIIETANILLDQTYVASHVDARPGPHVLLSISDNGVGMSDEVKAHLFEPFFTTKERGHGTGLGLATVFGIVKQSGGHIRVYSEVGQGTTFKIYLPCAEEVEAQPFPDTRSALASSLVRGTETVLIVEDRDEVRDLAAKVLRAHGYQVLTAANGPEALQVSRQHEGPIHLLLTDVVMPRMSGKELADQMRNYRPDLRVLYMSGYADHAILENGVLAPHAVFLSKPFTVEDLMQKVRAVLDGRI